MAWTTPSSVADKCLNQLARSSTSAIQFEQAEDRSLRYSGQAGLADIGRDIVASDQEFHAEPGIA